MDPFSFWKHCLFKDTITNNDNALEQIETTTEEDNTGIMNDI